jgi:threonylcarbamoyladenosine tRNA methylthiotransferase MtaB
VADVVREIKDLSDAGYREAVLTGVHLGAYGADTGESLSSLLAALLAETSIPRLRLSSLEPFDLSPELFRAWGESGGRLMPHLHLPAQSGSDQILRRMGRRNRVADYEALVRAARVAVPGLTVTTDLMTGFPGESESQFAETLSFAARLRFAHIHVFTYSQRPGTAAATFPDQIPTAERRRRSQLLSRTAGEISRSVRLDFLGQIRPVLWESRAPDRSAGLAEQTACAVWSGLTDNYLRVHMRAQEDEDLGNRIHPVRLVALGGKAFEGEVAP